MVSFVPGVFRRKGKRPVVQTIAIVGILLLSTNVFARILSLPLESRYDGINSEILAKHEFFNFCVV